MLEIFGRKALESDYLKSLNPLPLDAMIFLLTYSDEHVSLCDLHLLHNYYKHWPTL